MRALFVLVTVSLFILGCDGPEPLSFDSTGQPHGTGTKTYSYSSGTVMLEEHYTDGQLVLSQWFKPDGALIQTTKWIEGSGEGLYLRQDGSIRVRMHYVNHNAEGEAVYYDENGNITKTVLFHDGQPVGD